MPSAYISYYYQHSPYKEYHNAKEDLKSKYSVKNLREKALAVWRQGYGETLPADVENYMNFMFSVDQNNSFQSSLQQIINSAPFEGLRDIGTVDTKQIADLQEIFNQVESLFNTFDSRYLNETFSSIFKGEAAQALITAAINKTSLTKGLSLTSKGHTSKAYKDKLYAATRQIQDGIKEFSAYKQLSSEMKRAVNSISSAYAQLAIIQQLLGNQKFVGQSAADHFFRAYLDRIQTVLGVGTGIVREAFTQELLNNNVPVPNTSDTVISTIAKVFSESSGGSRVPIKATPISATAAKGADSKGKAMGTVPSTSDIRFNITSTGGDVSMNVPLPSISIKETISNFDKSEKKNIRIKTRATLFKLLHDMPQGQIYYLLNFLYASANRSYVRLKKDWPPQTTRTVDLNHATKAALIANGLMGQMTTEDFAYLFMLNGKVYTVPEVIQEILSADDPTSLQKGSTSLVFQGINKGKGAYKFIAARKGKTSQDAAIERSGNVQSYLLNKVTLQMEVRLGQK